MPFDGSFLVLFKAVLKVGTQAIFPFKRLFKRGNWEIVWAPYGNNNQKEKDGCRSGSRFFCDFLRLNKNKKKQRRRIRIRPFLKG